MKVMRDLVGETLSHRYRLVARVAGGGMGEVYRGHDLLLDRSVAVKILQPSLASDPLLVERFRAEARAAARLTHPNIVGVHDWGCEGDRTYYMVMEYVSGTDLRDVLVARGNLEPRQAIDVVVAVCDALEVAHSKGLVHRDVKPENILLNRSGEVKVADFGIAIVADADRTSPGGMIPGTLRYLSPEQARGSEASAASDIWAAGAVLSELLTGLPPLQGAGGELLQRRAHEPPRPPSSWDDSIPKELDDIVLRACALDPADRFSSAAEMAAALRRIGAEHLPLTPPLESLIDEVTGEIALIDPDLTAHMERRAAKGPRRRPKLKTAFAVLLILLLIGGTAGAVSRYVMPQMVAVPNLEGLARDAAERRVANVPLELLVVGRQHHLDIARGAVIEQSPDTGELEEGSTIEVILSKGPPKVKLPSLVGMKLAKGEQRLADKDLLLGEVTKEYSVDVEEGTIISHDPEGGKLVIGSEVSLVVSKGPQPLEVPDVSGLAATKAVKKLEKAGFAAEPVDAYSDTVEEGIVIYTSPQATEVIGEGSTVEVYVSVGPEFKEVEMPDVRNMSLDAAKSKLTSLGLRVRVERPDPCGSANTVVETDPPAGTTVRENDLVALFVC